MLLGAIFFIFILMALYNVWETKIKQERGVSGNQAKHAFAQG